LCQGFLVWQLGAKTREQPGNHLPADLVEPEPSQDRQQVDPNMDLLLPDRGRAIADRLRIGREPALRHELLKGGCLLLAVSSRKQRGAQISFVLLRASE